MTPVAMTKPASPRSLAEYFAGRPAPRADVLVDAAPAGRLPAGDSAPSPPWTQTTGCAATLAMDASACQVVNPLDIPAWDQWVLARPEGTVFHTRAWMRVLRESYGFVPLAIVGDSLDRPGALLPLMECRDLLGRKRGVSLPFSDHTRPLAESEARWCQLWAAVLELGRRRGWTRVEFRGASPLSLCAQAAPTWLGHVLDLTPGPDALWNKVDSSVRRAIRKAQREGVVVRRETCWEAVAAFYQMHCQTRRGHGLPPQPIGFFRHLHQHFLTRDAGAVFTAYHRERPVAAAIFLHAGSTAVYKFGASERDSLQLRANNAVMWEAIRHHADGKLGQLDFGRTAPDQEGLRRYKLSWGTVEYPIVYTALDPHSGRVCARRNLGQGWHNWVFRRLPIPLLRWVGSRLYRFMT